MKKKGLLSLLLAFGIVFSSFGVVMAANPSGGFGSSEGGFYAWTYETPYKALVVRRTEDTSPAGSDFDNYAPLATSMHISDQTSHFYEGYTYSHFKQGMNSLKNLAILDNCKKLTIQNYCPVLEDLSFSNNSMKSVYVDLTNRSSGILPVFSIMSNTTTEYFYLDYEGYLGRADITVPVSYGNDSRVHYDFSKSPVIKSVAFEAGTKTIPEGAFYKCEKLTSVTIPNGVTKIEYSAFKECSKLESVTIPASVKSIGMNAFKNSGIKTINFGGTRAQWFDLVKEYDNNEELVGETLHLDGVTVHCSDGNVAIHYNKKDDPQYYQYYQNYYGWEKVDGNWYYYKADGSLAKGAATIDGNLFYFDNNGVMQTGWFHISGNLWSYADKTGVVKLKGWLQDGGSWYYFNLYFMQTGWRTIGGVKYYFDKTSGKMVTGWQEIDGKWYLFNSSGAMQTGWKQSGNTWYYLDPSDGSMVTGWKEIGGKWYFLKSNGAMAASEWCGGYWLNADGTWTYPYKATWRKTNNKWWFGDDSGWYAKNETLIIDGVSLKFDAKGYLV